jgi:glycosyltransferase involved in cell wall biosynthesis
MARHRILFIAAIPPPVTGQSLAGQHLLDDLQIRGHKVTLVNLSKKTFRQGVDSLARVVEIASVIQEAFRHRNSHDLIYFTPAESLAGNLKDCLLLFVLGSARRNTWIHLHGGAGMKALLSKPGGWLWRINHHLLRDIKGVIVLGPTLAPIYSGLTRPNSIKEVANFAPDDLFIDPESLKRKWMDLHAPKARLRVLFLSNHLPGKGHEELITAIESMQKDEIHLFQFDFAGGFESHSEEARFMERLERIPNAKHHGIVGGEAKRGLFSSAHVFCLPTYYPFEGQPISILEAYAAGCAVVTTAHSGIPDIFKPEENGWLVRKQDAAHLVDILRKAAKDTQATTAFGIHNHEYARANFQRTRHLQDIRNALGLE